MLVHPSHGQAQGLKGGVVLFPWMLDGALKDTADRVLDLVPTPVRLLYRRLWPPRYVCTPRWGHAW